jgi:Biotin-lipoyl like
VASGYVIAQRKATVAAEITGKVVQVLIDEGMVVNEGNVVGRLDSVLAERDLALARSRSRVRPSAGLRTGSGGGERRLVLRPGAACSRSETSSLIALGHPSLPRSRAPERGVANDGYSAACLKSIPRARATPSP